MYVKCRMAVVLRRVFLLTIVRTFPSRRRSRRKIYPLELETKTHLDTAKISK